MKDYLNLKPQDARNLLKYQEKANNDTLIVKKVINERHLCSILI